VVENEKQSHCFLVYNTMLLLYRKVSSSLKREVKNASILLTFMHLLFSIRREKIDS